MCQYLLDILRKKPEIWWYGSLRKHRLLKKLSTAKVYPRKDFVRLLFASHGFFSLYLLCIFSFWLIKANVFKQSLQYFSNINVYGDQNTQVKTVYLTFFQILHLHEMQFYAFIIRLQAKRFSALLMGAGRLFQIFGPDTLWLVLPNFIWSGLATLRLRAVWQRTFLEKMLLVFGLPLCLCLLCPGDPYN